MASPTLRGRLRERKFPAPPLLAYQFLSDCVSYRDLTICNIAVVRNLEFDRK